MNLLEEVVLGLERHAAEGGWDIPPRLFALVESAELRRHEPDVAAQLELADGTDTLTPVDQGELPESASLDETLAGILWPDAVSGCALIVERVVLPPEVEDEIPEDEAEVAAWVSAHPKREDVRMVVGVLRDGARYSAMRLRRHDTDDEVLKGPDLVPALADALAATLEPDVPPEPGEPGEQGRPGQR